ncbi:hypothetical protein [Candidatus Odyssella thessalonicensis]|uniref:hypothetical protein n=1 Tax=Candidatus Odyssella thessalonicensis TaxID=84647 RepID=UPI000225ACB9|nr:hypothetical protein [Candidatus Odyssella thessalonicensis]
MPRSVFTALSIKCLLLNCIISHSEAFDQVEDFIELSATSSHPCRRDTPIDEEAPAVNALTRFLSSITPLLSVEDENDPEAELYHWAGGCLMWMSG